MPDIAASLGVAKSTAFRWVRHLPLDPRSDRASDNRQRAWQGADAYWRAHRQAMKYRLRIHESADVAGATGWWAARLGIPAERFQRPTLKRHNPQPGRHNAGDRYRGCLIVTVPRSRELDWRVEGIMQGLGQRVGRPVVR